MSRSDAGDRLIERRKRLRYGRWAELIACGLLLAKGYRILARRYRRGPGEIDIIAKRGKVVAFVEVKARRDRTTALESITPAAQRRIVAAARVFVAEHPKAVFYTLRFDAVLIVPRRWPEHVCDAFRGRDPM